MASLFYVCRTVTVDGREQWLPDPKAVTANDASSALSAWTADGSVTGPVLAVPVGSVTRATVTPGPAKVKLS